jgi:hypothetical protein
MIFETFCFNISHVWISRKLCASFFCQDLLRVQQYSCFLYAKIDKIYSQNVNFIKKMAIPPFASLK